MKSTESGDAPAPGRPPLAWLPDTLTRARLLALPVLWLLALLGLPRALAVGAAAAALTDVADGIAARRLGVASPEGGARDSLADHLLSASLVAWLVLLRPEFVREQGAALVLWAGLALGVLAVALVLRGRPVNLHLYSAKAASFFGWTFAVLLLYTGTYSLAFFAVALVAASLAAVEALLVILFGRGAGHRGSLPPPDRNAPRRRGTGHRNAIPPAPAARVHPATPYGGRERSPTARAGRHASVG